jgi:hypothetical protein
VGPKPLERSEVPGIKERALFLLTVILALDVEITLQVQPHAPCYLRRCQMCHIEVWALT